MALSTASAPPTTSGGAKSLILFHQSDQALFIAAQRDLVACVSIQQQIRRADYEVSVNRLPLRDLTGDLLKAILTALGVDGGDQGGTTSYKGPEKRRNRAQESWINNGQSRLPLKLMNGHSGLSDDLVLVRRRVGVFDPEPGHIERWKEDEG